MEAAQQYSQLHRLDGILEVPLYTPMTRSSLPYVLENYVSRLLLLLLLCY